MIGTHRQCLALTGISTEVSRFRIRAIDCIKTQYRKDADHAADGGGQDGRPGEGCWALPAPSSRANPTLADCRRVLSGII